MARRRLWLGAVTAAVAAAAAVALVGHGPLLNAAGAPQLGQFFAAAPAPAPRSRIPLADRRIGAGHARLRGAGDGAGAGARRRRALLVSRRWWLAGARPGRGLRGGRRLGWLGARGALALPRGVHEVVWGLFLLALLGVDPLVAVLAIGLPYGAVTAKVLSELIDETDPAPFEAARAAGAGRVAAFAYGLLPAAAPDLLAYSFYRFDCAIRAAAVLGIVGAGGIGFQIALSFQEPALRGDVDAAPGADRAQRRRRPLEAPRCARAAPPPAAGGWRAARGATASWSARRWPRSASSPPPPGTSASRRRRCCARAPWNS